MPGGGVLAAGLGARAVVEDHRVLLFSSSEQFEVPISVVGLRRAVRPGLHVPARRRAVAPVGRHYGRFQKFNLRISI